MTRPVRVAAHIWPGGTPDYDYGTLRSRMDLFTEGVQRIKPTQNGYDFSTLTGMLAWRDANRSGTQ